MPVHQAQHSHSSLCLRRCQAFSTERSSPTLFGLGHYLVLLSAHLLLAAVQSHGMTKWWRGGGGALIKSQPYLASGGRSTCPFTITQSHLCRQSAHVAVQLSLCHRVQTWLVPASTDGVIKKKIIGLSPPPPPKIIKIPPPPSLRRDLIIGYHWNPAVIKLQRHWEGKAIELDGININTELLSKPACGACRGVRSLSARRTERGVTAVTVPVCHVCRVGADARAHLVRGRLGFLLTFSPLPP